LPDEYRRADSLEQYAFAKIPEFKYCAIRVTASGEVEEQSSYGGGQALAAGLRQRKS
jgi:hypothetical protein